MGMNMPVKRQRNTLVTSTAAGGAPNTVFPKISAPCATPRSPRNSRKREIGARSTIGPIPSASSAIPSSRQNSPPSTKLVKERSRRSEDSFRRVLRREDRQIEDSPAATTVSYTHLRAHETPEHL